MRNRLLLTAAVSISTLTAFWAARLLDDRHAIAAPTNGAPAGLDRAIMGAAIGLNPAAGSSMPVLNPGETSAALDATGCSSSDGQGFGVGNGAPCSQCTHTCSGVDSNTANARILFTQPVALQVFSTSTVYTEFMVSASDETEGNLLPCSINYNAEWKGQWLRFGVLTDGTSSKVRIYFTLSDLTENKPVVTHEVHSLQPQGAGLDIFELGAWINHDQRKDSFFAMLKRGHEYRLSYTLRLESTAWANAYVNLDYQTGGWGAWWNSLTVSLAEDPEDVVADLREELLYLIENHKHTYLTGHGVGQNNKQATSSTAILPQ